MDPPSQILTPTTRKTVEKEVEKRSSPSANVPSPQQMAALRRIAEKKKKGTLENTRGSASVAKQPAHDTRSRAAAKSSTRSRTSAAHTATGASSVPTASGNNASGAASEAASAPAAAAGAPNPMDSTMWQERHTDMSNETCRQSDVIIQNAAVESGQMPPPFVAIERNINDTFRRRGGLIIDVMARLHYGWDEQRLGAFARRKSLNIIPGSKYNLRQRK